MNILSRITARWLVGLLAVLIALAYVSDAGRSARSGFDLGHAALSSGDPADPVLASEAPQVDVRFRSAEKQPHVGGKSADDAVPTVAESAIPSGKSRAPLNATAATRVRIALFVPGQRTPPTVLHKA